MSWYLKIGGPKSICRCGHEGDGSRSAHSDTLQPGHGACNVPGCGCERFTWARFKPGFEARLERARK